MADTPIKVNELPSHANVELTDKLFGIGAAEEFQTLVSAVAKKIVEDYADTSLGGSSRSIKAAVDALKTSVDKMGALDIQDGQLTAGSTVDITLTNGAYLLVTFHIGNNLNSLHLLNAHTAATGNYRVVEVLANSNVTVSMTNAALSITNNFSNRNGNYCLIKISSRM